MSEEVDRPSSEKNPAGQTVRLTVPEELEEDLKTNSPHAGKIFAILKK